MPTKRYRRAPRRHEALSERARAHLESGHDWDWLDGEALTEAQLHELWAEHREDILPDYIREHPGCRPWAWWRWDRQMERPRQLGGRPAETEYLIAHGLLTDAERVALGVTRD